MFFIGTVAAPPLFSFPPFERQRLLLELFRKPFVMPPRPQRVPGVVTIAAFIVQPDSCVFVFRLNRPEVATKSVTGDPVTPEYGVGGHRIAWLSNRPQIGTKEASS